jgi:hypothetical protein
MPDICDRRNTHLKIIPAHGILITDTYETEDRTVHLPFITKSS